MAFVFFARLPGELQDMIWTLAATEPSAYFAEIPTSLVTEAGHQRESFHFTASPLHSNLGALSMVPMRPTVSFFTDGQRPGPISQRRVRKVPNPTFRHPKLPLLLACHRSRAAVGRVEEAIQMPLVLDIPDYPGDPKSRLQPFKPDPQRDLIILDPAWASQFDLVDLARWSIRYELVNGIDQVRYLGVPWLSFTDAMNGRFGRPGPGELADYTSDMLAYLIRRITGSLRVVYIMVDDAPCEHGEPLFYAPGREYFEPYLDTRGGVGDPFAERLVDYLDLCRKGLLGSSRNQVRIDPSFAEKAEALEFRVLSSRSV